MKYRSEIDGLRAIAVLAVILFHAKFNFFNKNFFEGGYLGVDIFFVISGYLITHIILSELFETGTFKFKNFYERRARRILPMLFVVILVSIFFAWKILLPSAYIELAESAIASIFFSSNFYFYFTTTEYGAESSILKPLLHTWSLGVEEQFYLIFPILGLVFFKYAKKYLLQILFLLLLVSLFLAEFIGQQNSVLNFFLPLSRFWELAIGSLLAFKTINYKENLNTFWHQLLPLLGLFLIFYSFYFFNEQTSHPNFITIIPVIGTALIIGYSSSSEAVGKMLSAKPMVGMGLISYSAYLWHFPLFAFYRNFSTYESTAIKFVLILATLLISIISFKFIESPFRNKKLITTKYFYLLTISLILLILSSCIAIINFDGFKQRYAKNEFFSNYLIDNIEAGRIAQKFERDRISKNPNFKKSATIKILIIGNSLGRDFYNGLTMNDLPDKIDILRLRLQITCLNEDVPEFLQNINKIYNSRLYKEATVIIISSRYQKSKCKKQSNHNNYHDTDSFKFIINRAFKEKKKVIVIGQNPQFNKINGKIVADYIYDKYSKKKENQLLNFNTIKDEANNLLYNQLIYDLDLRNKIIDITKQLNTIYIDRIDLVCDIKNKICDAFDDNGFKTFYDTHHWTIEGSKFFGQKLIDNGFLDILEKK